MRLPFWAQALLCAGSGLTAVFAFAPYHLPPLLWLGLALLFWLARATSARRAAVLAYSYGVGFSLSTTYWLYPSLAIYGGMPAVPAALCIAALAAFLALYPALGLGLAARWAPAVRWRLALAFPAGWLLSEWLRGWLFTGFPWASIGYAGMPDWPLAGYAPILGVYGVGLLLLLSLGALLLAKESWPAAGRQKRVPALAIGLLLSTWLVGALLLPYSWTQPVGAPLTVSLTQGNIPQDMKWNPQLLQYNLLTYLHQAQQAKGRLVLLPETAVPLFLHDTPPEYLSQLRQTALRRGADMILGIPRMADDSNQYYNTASLISHRNWPSYSKAHLVPFGEYIPLRWLLNPIYDSLHIPLTDFSRGATEQKPLPVADQQLAMNICYEDVFGNEIIRALPQATLLANLSNLAWFDGTVALAQHLQMSQTRALETGRVMLRATNTGATAAIDAHGQIIARLPERVSSVLEVTVQGRQGLTPYSRAGDGPAIGLAVLALLLACLASRRQSTRAAANGA